MANEERTKRKSGWVRKREKLEAATDELESLRDELQDGAAQRDRLLAEIASLRDQLGPAATRSGEVGRVAGIYIEETSGCPSTGDRPASARDANESEQFIREQ